MPLLSSEFKRSQVQRMTSLVQWFEKAALGKMRPAQVVLLTILYLTIIKFLVRQWKVLRKLTWMKVKEKIFRLARFVPQVQE
jgi:hypothetical protein